MSLLDSIRSRLGAPREPIPDDIEGALVRAVATRLGVEPDQVDPTLALADLGVDSTGAMDLTSQLEDRLGVQLTPTFFYRHPTLREAARALREMTGGDR
ncbi:MAG: acyl carrier protein [Alphaproteobacteria bacterium]|nr:acyl carrier protein [Alphaproteobacteria bacterium]